MAIKCKNTDMLLDFVNKKHLDVSISHPTDLQTKVTFSDGLIMNIFNTTGNVNFQGNSYENHVASDIVNVIEAINR